MPSSGDRAVPPPGAPAVVLYGVTGFDGVDGALEPTAFFATTVNV